MLYLIFLLTILGLLWVWLAQWRIWRAHRFLLESAQAPSSWRHNLALLPAFFLSVALLLSLLLYYLSSRQVARLPEAPAQLFVLLDCSASMEAEAWPGVSRLETAKKLLRQLPNELPDWEFALLTFAGVPLLDFPPSNDHRGWLDALAVAVPDGYLMPGSSPGKALQMAEETIELCASEKALILLFSDGEINVENLSQEEAYWRQRETPCLFLLQGVPGKRQKIPGAPGWLQTGNPPKLAYSIADEKKIRTCLGLSKSPFRIRSGQKEVEDIFLISDEIWSLTKRHSANKSQRRGIVFPWLEREGLLLAALCCLLAVFSSRIRLQKGSLFLLFACLGAVHAQEQTPVTLSREAYLLSQRDENQEDLRQAVALYRQALRLQPGFSLAAKNLEYTLIRLQQLENASGKQKANKDSTELQEDQLESLPPASNAAGSSDSDQEDGENAETGKALSSPSKATWRELQMRRRRPLRKAPACNPW